MPRIFLQLFLNRRVGEFFAAWSLVTITKPLAANNLYLSPFLGLCPRGVSKRPDINSPRLITGNLKKTAENGEDPPEDVTNINIGIPRLSATATVYE